METEQTVRGIENCPIYVVATETSAWAISPGDYRQGIPLKTLIDGLGLEEAVYLVHLDQPMLGVKLTRLT